MGDADGLLAGIRSTGLVGPTILCDECWQSLPRWPSEVARDIGGAGRGWLWTWDAENRAKAEPAAIFSVALARSSKRRADVFLDQLLRVTDEMVLTLEPPCTVRGAAREWHDPEAEAARRKLQRFLSERGDVASSSVGTMKLKGVHKLP
jgi:hypothetical protein